MIREEIDAAIARHADSELLVDQPYEDNKKVRVTGPFTVESLSPHRVLDDERPPPTTAEAIAADGAEAPGFEQTILDNLRKAGVQNTFKGERHPLRPARVVRRRRRSRPRASSPTPTGRAGGSASAIGPEYGTVGPDLVKEAAKEAMRGTGLRPARRVRASPSTPRRRSGQGARADRRRLRRRRRGASPRPAARAAGADEPGPGDGRRPAQEDRRRQPVHGLR